MSAVTMPKCSHIRFCLAFCVILTDYLSLNRTCVIICETFGSLLMLNFLNGIILPFCLGFQTFYTIFSLHIILAYATPWHGGASLCMVKPHMYGPTYGVHIQVNWEQWGLWNDLDCQSRVAIWLFDQVVMNMGSTKAPAVLRLSACYVMNCWAVVSWFINYQGC